MESKNQDNIASQQSDLFNFLKALAIGFGIISVGIAIAIVGYILVAKK